MKVKEINWEIVKRKSEFAILMREKYFPTLEYEIGKKINML